MNARNDRAWLRRVTLATSVGAMAAAIVWGGCGVDSTPPSTTTTGGQGGGATTATTTTTTAATGGGGGNDPCVGDPNGKCETGEDCTCDDCVGTAFCVPDQCVDDGVCDAKDSCICPDCDADYVCADPSKRNCEDDGVCRSYDEGCNCLDCADKTACLDNVQACSGGAGDGLCDLSVESCACVDCLGALVCATCSDNGKCDPSDGCFCADCLDDGFCNDDNNCYDDVICAPLYEGCGCPDCGSIEECGQGGGGGMGGGGAGGSGQGGSGGAGQPTCFDGVMNGAEIGVDCGGICGPCPTGQPCGGTADCLSGYCKANVCANCGFDSDCISGSCDPVTVKCNGHCGAQDVTPSPTSCQALALGAGNGCGPANNDNCCSNTLLTCGSYLRSYDGITYTSSTNPATVSDFRLDNYEVTVGRFRQWVNLGGGTQALPPATGSGANPHVANSGWSAAWTSLLAADTNALTAALACQGGNLSTWTSAAGANEKLPIGCVNWYEAFAFCAWDGGRLPTEAEWNYAAAGGTDQREYPWGSGIDDTYLVYNCTSDGVAGCAFSDISPVGSRSPKGDAKWGQHDMSGNMGEWVFDGHDPNGKYLKPCADCAETILTTNRVFRGQGFTSGASSVTVSPRFKSDASTGRTASLGVRCARNP